MPLNRHHRQHGLTLVELLVAVTLGALILATVVGVFIANSHNYKQNEAITSLQDNARFAMDSLARDLSMAGYWGGVRTLDAGRNVLVSAAAAGAISTTAVPGDCGPSTPPTVGSWLLNPAVPLEFRNHTETATATGRYRCLTALQPMTDVVMIRRVAGQPARQIASAGSATLNLITGRLYLKTNQSVGSLIRAGADSATVGQPLDCADPSTGIATGCPPQDLPAQLYAYVPSLYFIHNVSADVSVPTLCRYLLRDDDTGRAPAMEEDCLAEGVENLQLEWGIDGDDDNTIDRYLSNPSAADLLQARSVRIHLLVRAADPGGAASADAREYTLADYQSAADRDFARSGLLRRAFSSTVQIKNYIQ
ncbi:MAG: PilW family protein [Stagnimonas sp.]|nr:PilW family protein [Stagnimonas sp.]